MPSNLKHHSHIITDGRDRAGARAMLKAIGFTDEDLAKPIVGIANTWIETMPCNYHLRELAAKVKAGVRAAGGTPMEFNTIAISDGVTMGTEGMKASLVSREVVADSIELVGRGHMFDAMVALVGCDKTIPGGAMALIRLNVPSVLLYGGSIAAGRFQGRDVTIGDVYEARGRQCRRADDGRGTEATRRPRVSGRGRVRRPVHRQHHVHGDGVHRPLAHGSEQHSRSRPEEGRSRLPVRPDRDGSAEARSEAARHPDAQGLRERHRQRGGHAAAPPTPCCTCWPWRAKPASR